VGNVLLIILINIPTVETVGYGLYLYYQNMFFNIAHGFNRGERIAISLNSYINPTVETVGCGLYLYYQNMFFNIAHGFNRGETNCDFS